MKVKTITRGKKKINFYARRGNKFYSEERTVELTSAQRKRIDKAIDQALKRRSKMRSCGAYVHSGTFRDHAGYCGKPPGHRGHRRNHKCLRCGEILEVIDLKEEREKRRSRR